MQINKNKYWKTAMHEKLVLEKKELRKQIKNQFKTDEGLEIIKRTKKLFEDANECNEFLSKIPTYKKAKTVFAYLPLRDEFPTENILKSAFLKGKKIGLPVVQGKDIIFREMQFKASQNTEDIKTGSFGIMEPTEKNAQLYPIEDFSTLLPLIVLTPGRAFTQDGIRMGRGGGFYDNFFSSLFFQAGSLRSEIITVGICYKMQVVKSIPTEPHDIKVDMVITE